GPEGSAFRAALPRLVIGKEHDPVRGRDDVGSSCSTDGGRGVGGRCAVADLGAGPAHRLVSGRRRRTSGPGRRLRGGAGAVRTDGRAARGPPGSPLAGAREGGGG